MNGDYLVAVRWAVYDFGSSVVLGFDAEKSQAIASARKLLTSDRNGLLRCFIDGRARQAVLLTRVQEEIRNIKEMRHRKLGTEVSISIKRKRVFLQDGGKCHYCAAELELPGDWHMDHYVSRSNGGQNSIDNLVAACPPCNLRKGKLDGDEFRRLESIPKGA